MSKRAYRATRVNDVNWDQLAQGKEGLGHHAGCRCGQVQPLGGLSMGRWSVRTSLASPEP